MWIPDGFVKRADQWIRPGDAIMSMANSGNLVGKVACALEPLPERLTFGAFLSVLRPKAIGASYLFQFLRSPRTQEQLRASASQTVNIANLSVGRIVGLGVPVPPTKEQARIVAKLERLQARTGRAREALNAVPPLLEKLRQSILASAFRGDLTTDWRAKNKNAEPATKLLERIRTQRRKKWEQSELAKMKAKGRTPTDDEWKAKYEEPKPVDTTDLPELPEGWAWARLADVLLSLDQGWSPQCDSVPRTSPEEWAVMKTTAVQHNRFDENENKRLPAGLPPRPDSELRLGDLLITRAGPRVRAGVCCRVDRVSPRLMACDKVYRFRVDEAFALGECVELILNSPGALHDIEVMKTGISESGVNLTQEKFTALPIPLAPIDEQRVLVQRTQTAVRECDTFLRSHAAIAAGITTLERATLATAFRGDLVAQDPSDEPAEAMLARMRPQLATEDGAPVSAKGASIRRRRTG